MIDDIVRKVFVATRRSDGGVAIIVPVPSAMRELTGGGRPWLGPRRQIEIENLVRGNVPEDMAARWIDALIAGDATTAEAYEEILLRSREPDHAAIELVDIAEVPSLRDPDGNRWCRNAWRRSMNGGPIYIDLERAVPIEQRRLLAARQRALKQCEGDEAEALLMGKMAQLGRRERILDIDLAALGQRMRAARSEAELQALWPAAIPGGFNG